MSYISAEMDVNAKGFVDGSDVHVWECVDKKIIHKKYPGVFAFYEQDDFGEYQSVYGERLTKYEFDSLADFRVARKEKLNRGIKLYESDISADNKVLAAHYYNQPSPTLNVAFYDIEVQYRTQSFDDDFVVTVKYNGTEKDLKLGDIRSLSEKQQGLFDVLDGKEWKPFLHSKFTYCGPIGFSSPQDPYAPINAIALYKDWTDQSIVFALPPPGFDIDKDLDKSLLDLAEIRFFKNERSLLIDFIEEIEDAAVLSGYNSSGFDDPYTARRVEMVLGPHYFKKLSFEHAPIPRFQEVFIKGRAQLQVKFGGRVQLDYLELFKKFEFSDRASFKLESVSEDYLPHLKKLSYPGTLEQLYFNDFNYFLRYNIRDTEILIGLENKLNYLKVANEMVHSSTNQFKHIFGTVRMVDNAIINYCHYELNRIVPDRWDTKDGSIQGAYVLLPQRGMHKWICSIDINSLYPSAIRAINISPETIRGQFTRNVKDWACIYEMREEELTFVFEDGKKETKLTSEWIDFLLEKKWAVSGYGTAYTQEFKGIIPSLLEEWYTQRKKYQALSKKFYGEAVDLKANAGYDEAEYDRLMAEYSHYDRLQFIFKIKLNSTYGCLSNYNFRFFRLESGESTTGTGRMILKHQCRQVNLQLEGEYWIDFPLYETTKKIDEINKAHAERALDDEDEFVDIVHKDVSSIKAIDEAGRQEHYHAGVLTHELALDGPKFNGKFQSETVIYGDSVTGDTVVIFDNVSDTIENWFDVLSKRYDVVQMPHNVELLLLKRSYSPTNTPCVCSYDIHEWYNQNVDLIYRHKTEKQIYEITTSSGKSIKVTQDHSLIILVNGKLVDIRPTECKAGDIVLELPNDLDCEDCVESYITNIELLGTIDDWVYDISMNNKELPYFFGNGILIHNTDSSYFTLDINELDEVVKVADKVADNVNKSYPEFMRKAFLCQPEYDQLIKCGREIVGDSGIFVEKKRYIIHVNDNEGKRVDKMKIMGLDLKKTTLPKPIALRLTDYIRRLLAGEDWNDIAKDVVEYKESLMDFDNLQEVGLPKGINKIEEYTIKYQVEGLKARLPGHVAAAIFYNQCLKDYGDVDSLEIQSGMKIKVYYIKKKIGKFTSIALPTDAEHVPNWFIENFLNKIDKDKQLSRLIDNPLSNILKAVNLATPTPQTVHANDIFIF